MKNLILHLPHASTHFPHKIGFSVDETTLQEEILKLTDWFTDDLFQLKNASVVKADFSRIFCDVERFEDDAEEVMAKQGMGVLYEKTENLEDLRVVTAKLREEILQNYYRPHHQRLQNAVKNHLDLYGIALIVDCHSFPMQPLNRALDKRDNRPDFNIGTDTFHTPEKLVEISKKFFEHRGYSLGINWPFKGTIVPMLYYKNDKRVVSIMLEVNRSLYLKNGSNEKSENYDRTKLVVQDYLKLLKTEF